MGFHYNGYTTVIRGEGIPTKVNRTDNDIVNNVSVDASSETSEVIDNTNSGESSEEIKSEEDLEEPESSESLLESGYTASSEGGVTSTIISDIIPNLAPQGAKKGRPLKASKTKEKELVKEEGSSNWESTE